MDRERTTQFEIFEDLAGRQSLYFGFGYENEASFDGFSLIVSKTEIISFVMNDLADGRHIIIATMNGYTITITQNADLEVYGIHLKNGRLDIRQQATLDEEDETAVANFFDQLMPQKSLMDEMIDQGRPN